MLSLISKYVKKKNLNVASKDVYACLCCGKSFEARTADRARGWARYCSKSCKAKKQERKTKQYANFTKQLEEDSDNCFPDHSEEGFS